jgi:hypothetical protein
MGFQLISSKVISAIRSFSVGTRQKQKTRIFPGSVEKIKRYQPEELCVVCE